MWFWLLIGFLAGQASVGEASPPVAPDPGTAAVWVSVVDGNGRPVAEAPVGLKEGFFFLTENKTAGDGRFRFDGLPAGGRVVGVFKEGYVPATAWIELGPGEEKEVTFILEKQSPLWSFLSRWGFWMLLGGLIVLIVVASRHAPDLPAVDYDDL